MSKGHSLRLHGHSWRRGWLEYGSPARDAQGVGENRHRQAHQPQAGAALAIHACAANIDSLWSPWPGLQSPCASPAKGNTYSKIMTETTASGHASPSSQSHTATSIAQLAGAYVKSASRHHLRVGLTKTRLDRRRKYSVPSKASSVPARLKATSSKLAFRVGITSCTNSSSTAWGTVMLSATHNAWLGPHVKALDRHAARPRRKCPTR